MWSQRQLKRQKTMPRTKTQWDLLVDEMVKEKCTNTHYIS
jgi:hypothetical protein